VNIPRITRHYHRYNPKATPYAHRISRKSESVFNLISDSRDLTHDFLTFVISDAGRIGKKVKCRNTPERWRVIIMGISKEIIMVFLFT
jgi:hypothetical protein